MSGFKVVTTTSVILIGWLLIDSTHGSSSDQLDCKSMYSLNSNKTYDITFDCSRRGYYGFNYMSVEKYSKNENLYSSRFEYNMTTNTTWCKLKGPDTFQWCSRFKENYPDETYFESLQKKKSWWTQNANLKMSNIAPEGIHHIYICIDK
jgi:hypothetical protein